MDVAAFERLEVLTAAFQLSDSKRTSTIRPFLHLLWLIGEDDDAVIA